MNFIRGLFGPLKPFFFLGAFVPVLGREAQSPRRGTWNGHVLDIEVWANMIILILCYPIILICNKNHISYDIDMIYLLLRIYPHRIFDVMFMPRRVGFMRSNGRNTEKTIRSSKLIYRLIWDDSPYLWEIRHISLVPFALTGGVLSRTSAPQMISK